MKLIFKSESDSPELVAATKEYENIWREDGEKVLVALREATRLPDPADEIQVVVREGVSFSGSTKLNEPMRLRASYSRDVKKGTLIHELGHRYLEGIEEMPANVDEHRALFTFLYDVWADLYGFDFAHAMVAEESKRKGVYDYQSAWDSVLGFSMDWRAAEYERILHFAAKRKKLLPEVAYIGFAPDLVPPVRSGEKTLTYRLGAKYEVLKPGDSFPVKDSGTGEIFGSIEIKNVEFLNFGDLPIDRPGHEKYLSKEDQRKVFEKYYGKVNDYDPVTILEFEYSPNK